MTCPEEPLIAFLAGELTEEEERRFDEHLLGCEHCWRAVQADRAARLAIEQLREPAPAGLKGRVSLAVTIAAGQPGEGQGQEPVAEATGPDRPESRRGRRMTGAPGPGTGHGPAGRRPGGWHRAGWAGAATAVAAALAVAGWAVTTGRGPADPPQETAVAAMVTPQTGPSSALRAGEHMVIAHQSLVVRAYELSDGEAVVATSARPFPVPPTSHVLSGSSSKAWMATKGKLSMYGVNRPSGQQSMFLVAAMPMAELPEVAAHLHLI